MKEDERFEETWDSWRRTDHGKESLGPGGLNVGNEGAEEQLKEEMRWIFSAGYAGGWTDRHENGP